MSYVVFADAEAAVIQFLRRYVKQEFTYSTDFPEDESPVPHIVVRRYGGNYKNDGLALDYARFSIESWSTDRGRAQDALQEVIGCLHWANKANYPSYDGAVIAKVFVESAPQYFPDKVSGEHRWLSTVAVYLRPKSSAQGPPPFLLTLAANGSNSRHIRASVAGAAPGVGQIDWGDGIVADLEINGDGSGTLEHVYETPGSKTVKFTDSEHQTAPWKTIEIPPVSVKWTPEDFLTNKGTLIVTGVTGDCEVYWDDGSEPEKETFTATKGKFTAEHTFKKFGNKTKFNVVVKCAAYSPEETPEEITIAFPADVLLDVQLFDEDEPRKVRASVTGAAPGKGSIDWGE